MGMFDYIKCEAKLPGTDIPPPDEVFQTKDTDSQYLTLYTITADGYLEWKPFKMVTVPKAERPYPDAEDGDWRAMCGIMRREEKPTERAAYDGVLNFYTLGDNGGWWEYDAHFQDGRLIKIDLVEFRAPPPKPQETP